MTIHKNKALCISNKGGNETAVITKSPMTNKYIVITETVFSSQKKIEHYDDRELFDYLYKRYGHNIVQMIMEI